MLFRSLRHAVLPIMLSSKLLPEMESEEAALKEQILAGVSNLPLQLQTEKLQALFVSQFLLYHSYRLCVCVSVCKMQHIQRISLADSQFNFLRWHQMGSQLTLYLVVGVVFAFLIISQFSTIGDYLNAQYACNIV